MTTPCFNQTFFPHKIGYIPAQANNLKQYVKSCLFQNCILFLLNICLLLQQVSLTDI